MLFACRVLFEENSKVSVESKRNSVLFFPMEVAVFSDRLP